MGSLAIHELGSPCVTSIPQSPAASMLGSAPCCPQSRYPGPDHRHLRGKLRYCWVEIGNRDWPAPNHNRDPTLGPSPDPTSTVNRDHNVRKRRVKPPSETFLIFSPTFLGLSRGRTVAVSESAIEVRFGAYLLAFAQPDADAPLRSRCSDPRRRAWHSTARVPNEVRGSQIPVAAEVHHTSPRHRRLHGQS